MKRGFLGSPNKKPVNSRMIHKSMREVLIDTLQEPTINSMNQASNNTVHRDTIHSNTAHPITVHPVMNNPIHQVSIDTTCVEIEKVEVLIMRFDENEMLWEKSHTRNSAWQLNNVQGVVIPDVVAVAEMNDFDLSCEWYDWVSQDPFQGIPHKDPRNHIKKLEDLASEKTKWIV